MEANSSQLLTVPGSDQIREILVKRVNLQKQAMGLAVGVIEPSGRRVVSYGRLARGDSRAVDGDTIFEIGSITKVFTSLVLADMTTREEVALDDPAAKYLPANVKLPQRNCKAITLLDLSTHHSGLPPFLGPGSEYSSEELYQFLADYTLPRDPGSEYEYSNLGAGLLGHALARRAGTDYESLIESRVARPLGMRDTGIALSSSTHQRMAGGNNAVLAPVAGLELPTPLQGAGALRSSANDMLTLVEAFLGYRESPLAPAMRAMLDVRRPAGHATIGLGWLVMSVHGVEIIGHNGRTGGFCSSVGYNPEARIGVVVLSNSSTAIGVDDICLHLLNPQFPLASPVPPEEHTEIRIGPRLLENYVGRYQVMPNLIFEITRDGDRLFAQGFAQLPQNPPGDPTGLPKFELFAEGEKNFFARVADNQITFDIDAEGRSTGLTLHKGGRDMPAPRME